MLKVANMAKHGQAFWPHHLRSESQMCMNLLRAVGAQPHIFWTAVVLQVEGSMLKHFKPGICLSPQSVSLCDSGRQKPQVAKSKLWGSLLGWKVFSGWENGTSTAQAFAGAFGVLGGAIISLKTLMSCVFQQRDMLITLRQYSM